MNSTLRYIESSLKDCIPESELRETALWIAEEACGLSRTEILCKDTTNIPNLEIILERVRSGEPLQYVFGRTKWDGLDLKLSPATLIPRPETWELVEQVSDAFSGEEALRVLDIGTGSGCIAIALKKKQPNWQIEACDISLEALQIATENAKQNDVDIRFFECDILNDSIDSYDIIVSNPPYVRECEKANMEKRVLDFEPHQALFVSDENPLLFYHRIATLKKAKHLFFEINEYLADEMKQLMIEAGYTNVKIRQDIFGKPRILSAELTIL